MVAREFICMAMGVLVGAGIRGLRLQLQKSRLLKMRKWGRGTGKNGRGSRRGKGRGEEEFVQSKMIPSKRQLKETIYQNLTALHIKSNTRRGLVSLSSIRGISRYHSRGSVDGLIYLKFPKGNERRQNT